MEQRMQTLEQRMRWVEEKEHIKNNIDDIRIEAVTKDSRRIVVLRTNCLRDILNKLERKPEQ